MRPSEQTEVRLSGSLGLAALEGIEACAISEDVVALLARVLEDVDAIGAARTGGAVGQEEAEAAAEEDVDGGAERSVSNELLSDDVLLVTIPDVRGKRGRGRVL